MSKHTPGPWEAKTSPSNHRRFVIWSEKETGAAVAETMNWLPTDPYEEIMANANLIAAAPAMYELIEKFGNAVTDMFEQMEKGNWVDDHGHRVQMNKQMMDLVPIVDEAIALRAPIRGES